MTTTPLGTALLMRPKPLSWSRHEGGWVAHSAVGFFTALPVPARANNVHSQGLWYPALNHAPFPVIAPTRADACNLALLGQIVHGDLTQVQLQWSQQGAHWHAEGYDGQGAATRWSVQPSEGTAGWYTLRNNTPSFVGLADAEQAQAACAQYAAYLWLALGEVVRPA